MSSYYECHVTMLGDPKSIRQSVESIGWKFSVIDGDPVLGDGVKCYATTFFNKKTNKNLVIASVQETAKTLGRMGITVLRDKVEHVIYDSKSVKTNCTGGCKECHMDDLT